MLCIHENMSFQALINGYLDGKKIGSVGVLVVYRINFDEFVLGTSVLKNQGLKSLLQTYLPLRTNGTDH